MASGLEIDEFEFLFGTPRTPEGAADPGSIAPRTPPGQGRRISKKIKPIEQFAFKLNGNYIQVVSRGACDRKGVLQGSISSLKWAVKMFQN